MEVKIECGVKNDKLVGTIEDHLYFTSFDVKIGCGEMIFVLSNTIGV